MAVVNKQWSNGDTLAFDMNSEGILVSSAPNNTGAPRQMTVNVKTTNEGVQTSEALTVSQQYLLTYGRSCGTNSYGQCGVGNNTDPITTPGFMLNFQTWKRLSSSGLHSLGINNGNLYSWGYNFRGELGLNHKVDMNTPQLVGSFNDWDDCFAGINISMAIRDGGKLYSCGTPINSMCGLGLNVGATVFTQVGVSSGWKKIAIGDMHCAGIKEDGTLWVWGHGGYGALGLGDSSNRVTPTQVGTDTDYTDVAAGTYITIAIKNGRLVSSGANWGGALGHANSNVFQPIGSIIDWTSVSVSKQSCYAIRQGGYLYAWGIGDYSGAGSNYSTPYQISTLSGWTHASIGPFCGGAINSGKLYLSGYNQGGELGFGDSINKLTLTQYGTDEDWMGVSCGATNLHYLTLKKS